MLRYFLLCVSAVNNHLQGITALFKIWKNMEHCSSKIHYIIVISKHC